MSYSSSWRGNHESGASFVPLDDAGNWLHLGLGVGMVGLGPVLDRTQLNQALDR